MKKIIFINPFPRTLWTGGIKTTYCHASILHQNGFDAQVFQPDGAPDSLPELENHLVTTSTTLTPETVTVFPEILNDFLHEWIQDPKFGKKYIFCQNQYYFYTFNVSRSDLETFGVKGILCPSETCKQSLMSILGVPSSYVHVVPCIVDRDVFKSDPVKTHQIVTASRKWPSSAGLPAYSNLIQDMLGLKYPEFKDTNWIRLEHRPQQEVVTAMNASSIFLSLSRLESLGLTPLEAMSARCLVIGFHGTGGLEYATTRNGFWFSPEQLEEIVDAIALALTELPKRNPVLESMLSMGEYTADQFSQANATRALIETYRAL